MRAAVLHDVRDIRVTDIPTPTPAADEVIVRVKAVGVCGSDLHSYLEGGTTGPTRINPFVLGHEFSGTLMPESARKFGLPADALMAVDPAIACGNCECVPSRPHQSVPACALSRLCAEQRRDGRVRLRADLRHSHRA